MLYRRLGFYFYFIATFRILFRQWVSLWALNMLLETHVAFVFRRIRKFWNSTIIGHVTGPIFEAFQMINIKLGNEPNIRLACGALTLCCKLAIGKAIYEFQKTNDLFIHSSPSVWHVYQFFVTCLSITVRNNSKKLLNNVLVHSSQLCCPFVYCCNMVTGSHVHISAYNAEEKAEMTSKTEN